MLRGRGGGGGGGKEGVEESLVKSESQRATLNGGHGPADVLVRERRREGGRSGGKEVRQFGFERLEVDDAPMFLTQSYERGDCITP